MIYSDSRTQYINIPNIQIHLEYGITKFIHK